MGRKKAPEPPAFVPTETRYGDTVIARTSIDPVTGNFVNQYIPEPVEVKQKNLTQEKINNVMATLGQTPAEMTAQYDSTANSFVNDAQKTFMQQYDPALRSLKDDIASRFGTLTTSMFTNDLNTLENNRASGFADIANKAQMLKSDLVNQSESNKLNQIQALGGVLNNNQNNFLNNLQAPVSAGKMYNDFQNGQYMSQLNDFKQNLTNKRALMSGLISSTVSLMGQLKK